MSAEATRLFNTLQQSPLPLVSDVNEIVKCITRKHMHSQRIRCGRSKQTLLTYTNSIPTVNLERSTFMFNQLHETNKSKV